MYNHLLIPYSVPLPSSEKKNIGFSSLIASKKVLFLDEKLYPFRARKPTYNIFSHDLLFYFTPL